MQRLGAGRKAWGYFLSDLTLKQVQELWATQSFPERDQSQDNKHRCAQRPALRLRAAPAVCVQAVCRWEGGGGGGGVGRTARFCAYLIHKEF